VNWFYCLFELVNDCYIIVDYYFVVMVCGLYCWLVVMFGLLYLFCLLLFVSSVFRFVVFGDLLGLFDLLVILFLCFCFRRGCLLLIWVAFLWFVLLLRLVFA